MFEKIWFFELLTFIKLSAKLPPISYLLISYAQWSQNLEFLN